MDPQPYSYAARHGPAICIRLFIAPLFAGVYGRIAMARLVPSSRDPSRWAKREVDAAARSVRPPLRVVRRRVPVPLRLELGRAYFEA